MKRSNKYKIILIIITIITNILIISCNSVFSATISGVVKAEPRNNSSSDEQTNLSDANVFVFFDKVQWQNYKTQWENANLSTQRTLKLPIALPSVSKTVRTTSTNDNGNFSIKTMWNTNSPIFGKDGDESKFFIAVYHSDYGMFFDDTEYSVFSDSSQNISFVCKYEEKQQVEYSIEINTFDYSNNNNQISLDTLNAKVVIKYKLYDINNEESQIGEITQIYEEVQNDENTLSNTYKFICDKYYYDEINNKYTNTRVYPKGYIYFYDKAEEDEKSFRMCDENGSDLSLSGTDFNITSNSNNLRKDIYIDRLNREYSLNFNLKYPKDNETNDYSGSPPSLEEFSPRTTIKVYFDGYDSLTNTIITKNGSIESSEEYKTYTFTSQQIPTDGSYRFNVNRVFDTNNNEVFPSITFLLEDDENNEEYVHTNINGDIISENNTLNNTLTNYFLDNYSTTVDAYLDRVKLEYTIQFNLEDFENGNTINFDTEDNATQDTFNPIIKLFILPYDGNSSSISTLDFNNATIQTPSDRINNNTFSFDWDKYDSSNNIQYPIIKYFIYDTSTPLYCQLSSDDNINFTHIKDYETVINKVEPIAYKKGILNESTQVELEMLKEEYSISFILKDIEDNKNQVPFNEFDPKVKLNIYKTSLSENNLVSSDYYKTSNTNGVYVFSWDKYGKNIDLNQLPTLVNEDRIYPLVKYYLFNPDENSYQMLLNDSISNPIVVSDINTSPSTDLFNEYETNKNVDVYIRNKKINFNLEFTLMNIATDKEISLREVNPQINLTYNNGIEDISESFSTIPNDEIYNIEINRVNNNISTPIEVELIDKRDEVRYRLTSNDPNNIDPTLRYTVGTSDTDRYKEQFTLTKANNNNLKLYIKDYQYISPLKIEGRFIENDDISDNYHDVWIIAEINNVFNEEDAIKLSNPTHSKYINSTDVYNPSNIENGYFSTTYNQNRIASFNQYLSSFKFLTQQFKVIVNKIRQEPNSNIDTNDYMNLITVKNNATDSVYVYVDTLTNYSN